MDYMYFRENIFRASKRLKWAVGTRAELDAAGWAEESFPNEHGDY